MEPEELRRRAREEADELAWREAIGGDDTRARFADGAHLRTVATVVNMDDDLNTFRGTATRARSLPAIDVVLDEAQEALAGGDAASVLYMVGPEVGFELGAARYERSGRRRGRGASTLVTTVGSRFRLASRPDLRDAECRSEAEEPCERSES